MLIDSLLCLRVLTSRSVRYDSHHKHLKKLSLTVITERFVYLKNCMKSCACIIVVSLSSDCRAAEAGLSY